MENTPSIPTLRASMQRLRIVKRGSLLTAAMLANGNLIAHAYHHLPQPYLIGSMIGEAVLLGTAIGAHIGYNRSGREINEQIDAHNAPWQALIDNLDQQEGV